MSAVPVADKKVLLVWWPLSQISEGFGKLVASVKRMTGGGSVLLEDIERLKLSNHAGSSFDTVYCGKTSLLMKSESECADIFAEISRILKPGGCIMIDDIVVYKNVVTLRSAAELARCLKLSGFTDVTPKVIPDVMVPAPSIMSPDMIVYVVDLKAFKPNFEIGSSVPLPFAKQVVSKLEDKVAKMWTLTEDDILDENVELINEDDLLDEDDLKKPDPTLLKVCATTKKRKACKNCSCGLAEELENEKKVVQRQAGNSACGNCYLGDAFRCASCPYLGMPAFKSGEKINLTERQLKADV